MRILFRILGTWLLVTALILIIVDGTKSLAANDVVMTSLSEGWQMVHAPSYASFVELAESSDLAWMWNIVSGSVLDWPGWAVFGVPGLLFAFFGRSTGTRVHSFDHS